MREILFRGQTRKYGEKVRIGDGQKLPGRWVYGGVLQGSGSHSIIYGGENINDPSQSIEKWCVHTDTLGQYTGLKDKHGKRIFEGDILRSRYDDLYPDDVAIEVVKWFRNGWYIQQGENLPDSLDEDGVLPGSEIIGNITDNPELLEK